MLKKSCASDFLQIYKRIQIYNRFFNIWINTYRDLCKYIFVIIMAIATDKSLKMFEIIPPAATEFPSIINNCQDKFIKKCNPIGHQRLKFHFI